MAKQEKAPRTSRFKRKPKDTPGRISQLRSAYTMTRKADPRIGWILLGIFVAVMVVFVGLGILLKHAVLLSILGLSVSVLLTTFVFGRRAERSAYAQVEGQPGAALSALSTLRKGFTVESEPVAFNRQQDLVIRVVGKCGVVLVGDGAPSRLQHMLVAEKKRHQRVLGDIPIHELQAGNAEGQIALRKLRGTIMKLPRTLNGPQMTELDHRLKALAVTRGTLPIPKGPLPKGIKVPRASG
jgi:Domain of unknown function (DUF4191)